MLDLAIVCTQKLIAGCTFARNDAAVLLLIIDIDTIVIISPPDFHAASESSVKFGTPP